MKSLLSSALAFLAITTATFAAASNADLVTGYVPIAKALAADDFPAVQAAASALSKQAIAGGAAQVGELARAVAQAGDIAQARGALRPLTQVIEPMAADIKDVTVMYCPMTRGTWVQAGGPVQNPYHGKVMLACGGPKTAQKQRPAIAAAALRRA